MYSNGLIFYSCLFGNFISVYARSKYGDKDNNDIVKCQELLKISEDNLINIPIGEKENSNNQFEFILQCLNSSLARERIKDQQNNKLSSDNTILSVLCVTALFIATFSIINQVWVGNKNTKKPSNSPIKVDKASQVVVSPCRSLRSPASFEQSRSKSVTPESVTPESDEINPSDSASQADGSKQYHRRRSIGQRGAPIQI